jgi:hypothetical protein
MHLELIYRARYNGWDIVDENGAEVENDDLIDDLAEFTYELCDEDGVFEHDEFTSEQLNEIRTIVNSYFENPVYKIRIDFRFS